jgi:hypothetical protein
MKKVTLEFLVPEDIENVDVMNLMYDSLSEFVSYQYHLIIFYRMNGHGPATEQGAKEYVAGRYKDNTFINTEEKVKKVLRRCEMAREIRNTLELIP